MGRRALRKIDASLDLSRHFVASLEDIPQPFDAAALFGRGAPLEIDVGCGKGMFLAGAAQATPEHDFLGIEVAARYARFAAAKLARLEVSNAKVIRGDAVELFSKRLPENSLAAVHVYFPDPWWKKRHRKRRVMRAEFVRAVQRALAPGGRLHFWTDVREYFDAAVAEIEAETNLSRESAEPAQPAPGQKDSPYRTHFDRRMRLSDEPVFRAEFSA